MRPRGAALAATLAAAAVGAAGCGGSDKPKTGLRWEGTPSVFRSKTLPHDRVVIARVRNVGSTTMHLVAAKLIVRDADGHALKSNAGFTPAFAHGLFGALQQPKPVPPAELIRLGKVVYIPAGASVPFYAAWTLTAKVKEPVSIDYGTGTLEVPPATGTTKG